jgi:hypothetical protein
MATDLSLEQASPPAGAVGTESYHIRPDGLAFSVEVTVTLKYAAKDLGGRNEQELNVATYDDSKRSWQPLTNQVVDVVTHEVRGGTRTIAKGAYGKVFATRVVSGADGGIDFPMGGGSGIGGASGTSGGTGMGGTATRKDAGVPVGGGGSIGGSGSLGGAPALPDSGPMPVCFPEHNVAPVAPYPTCADATVCSTLPGTYVQSCVDGPNGYDAQCCK